VLVLSIALIVAVAAVAAGVLAAKTGRYRAQICGAWALVVLGTGLCVTVRADSALALPVVFIDLACAGVGVLISSNGFPILAPRPSSIYHWVQSADSSSQSRPRRTRPPSPSRRSRATSPRCAASVRAGSAAHLAYAQVWGVAIGGAVLQNALQARLPSSVVASAGGGPGGASASTLQLSLIPLIRTLPAPQRAAVQAAFADSLREVWKVVLGVAAGGLAASAAMREVKLHAHTDDRWALEQPGSGSRGSGGASERADVAVGIATT
jgi:hypothetical protein